MKNLKLWCLWIDITSGAGAAGERDEEKGGGTEWSIGSGVDDDLSSNTLALVVEAVWKVEVKRSQQGLDLELEIPILNPTPTPVGLALAGILLLQMPSGFLLATAAPAANIPIPQCFDTTSIDVDNAHWLLRSLSLGSSVDHSLH